MRSVSTTTDAAPQLSNASKPPAGQLQGSLTRIGSSFSEKKFTGFFLLLLEEEEASATHDCSEKRPIKLGAGRRNRVITQPPLCRSTGASTNKQATTHRLLPLCEELRLLRETPSKSHRLIFHVQ